MPTIGGAGKIIAVWPGPLVFLEYNWYPSEEACVQVVELGQASKEGFVDAKIIPP